MAEEADLELESDALVFVSVALVLSTTQLLAVAALAGVRIAPPRPIMVAETVATARSRGPGAGVSEKTSGATHGMLGTAGATSSRAPARDVGVRAHQAAARVSLPEVEDEADEWGLPGSERSCGTQLSEREKRGGDQG